MQLFEWTHELKVEIPQNIKDLKSESMSESMQIKSNNRFVNSKCMSFAIWCSVSFVEVQEGFGLNIDLENYQYRCMTAAIIKH